MQEGWVCPKCSKVHAPFVQSCDCTEKAKQLQESLRRAVMDHLPKEGTDIKEWVADVNDLKPYFGAALGGDGATLRKFFDKCKQPKDIDVEATDTGFKRIKE